MTKREAIKLKRDVERLEEAVMVLHQRDSRYPPRYGPLVTIHRRVLKRSRGEGHGGGNDA